MVRSKWHTTDASCNQRCRIYTYGDGHKEYEYEQTIDGTHGSALIDVRDYEGDLMSYLAPYGYNSVDDVVRIYGENWEQIVAECIFETDFYEYI